ncbi:uncharacterized protein N7443_004580 [Penicillium atrosanguineum]|uniref:uncharacterized protein n=1 Tax=Penicillium atrosanguineum TaxID=1132637 RepID=UPI00239C0698|nr:uncharacterized protein N7443_004580 [Penicillium atrosanguineum]KAJ5133795.1 hypothetical protein N7526_005160 [Penicillium atrosanguineum]KAJ5304920.1 hypothetical protein N7443_004580 [Penicillium atrosanguineum]
MAQNTKIIVITGATGTQGSSVARTFLALPNWHVRCITRNPSGAAAQALASAGAEIVQADLSDLPSLRRGFTNAHAIFLNTDFWAPYVASKDSTQAYQVELLHGRNAALAAADIPSLERFVYSTLAPIKKHSRGKYSHSYHWDAKADVAQNILTETPQLAKKTSFVVIGAYAINPLFMPKITPTGGYLFAIPGRRALKIPVIDTQGSTGHFVRALIEDEPAGTRLLAYDSYISMEEIVEVWKKVTGHNIEVVEMNAETMRREFGIPLEVLDAPWFIDEFGYTGGIEGVIDHEGLKVKVQTKSFEEWLEKQDWREMLAGGKEQLASVSD